MSPVVVIDQNILGGTPVIAGTRVPVERLKFLASNGNVTTTELKNAFPHVSTKKIYQAIAFLMGVGIEKIVDKDKIQQP